MPLFYLATANTGVVDICITTSWTELEGVCMIADLLARRMLHCPTHGPQALGAYFSFVY